jgi:predicted RND superfamily exporter protein
VFNYVQTLAASNRDIEHEIYVAGQPILTGWVYSHQVEMLSIFAVTTAALVLSLVLYMANVAGVVTPLLVTSIVAAIWGFGFVGWLAKPIEPLIMVVPLLLVADLSATACNL